MSILPVERDFYTRQAIKHQLKAFTYSEWAKQDFWVFAHSDQEDNRRWTWEFSTLKYQNLSRAHSHMAREYLLALVENRQFQTEPGL